MDQIPFTIGGVVKKNKGRGKKLGFPTANLEIPLDLPEGIFVGHTKYKEVQYPSLIFLLVQRLLLKSSIKKPKFIS